jgi:hypothetical protein
LIDRKILSGNFRLIKLLNVFLIVKICSFKVSIFFRSCFIALLVFMFKGFLAEVFYGRYIVLNVIWWIFVEHFYFDLVWINLFPRSFISDWRKPFLFNTILSSKKILQISDIFRYHLILEQENNRNNQLYQQNTNNY